MTNPNVKILETDRCPVCLGWGFVMIYVRDQEDDVDCRACDGTGRRKR